MLVGTTSAEHFSNFWEWKTSQTTFARSMIS